MPDELRSRCPALPGGFGSGSRAADVPKGSTAMRWTQAAVDAAVCDAAAASSKYVN